ncbi:hypothetical protein K040078D81_13540 [Blautia hominis]|uniref:Bacterial repeat domain-containing protein n=1 Tax=Blautia hominis TaxID=2025493 RepID=A0ABQ0B708_9FIRM
MKKGKRRIVALFLVIVFCLSGNSMAFAAPPPVQTEGKSDENVDMEPKNNKDILTDDKEDSVTESTTDTQVSEKTDNSEDVGDVESEPTDNITEGNSQKPQENTALKQPETSARPETGKSTEVSEDKESESKTPAANDKKADDKKADDQKEQTSETNLQSQASAASASLSDRAVVPSSQTRILTNFSLGDDSMLWPGSGTEQDPKVQAGKASKDTFIVQAIDSLASINGGGDRFEQLLDYGANTINLKVIARDQVSVTYYRLTIERTKSPQNNTPSGNQFYPIAASAANAEDGGIQGFDKSQKYDYRKVGDPGWTPVPENAAEVTGLSAGEYEIRYGETESMLAGLNSVKVTVPVGTLYTIKTGPWFDSQLQTVRASNIVIPSTATEGSLVTLSATLPSNDLFITKITCKQDVPKGQMYVQTDEPVQCLITPDGSGSYTYQLSFKMVGYNIELAELFYKTGAWYTAELDDTLKMTVNNNITPAVPNDSFTSSGVTYYKDGSTVTSRISLVASGKYTINKVTATDKTTGQEVASNAGDTLTFEITSDVIITADLSIVPADFTELDGLLAQIPTGDIMVLEDASLVEIAPLLALLPNIRTLSGSTIDKVILKNYIDNLKKAVSSMKYRSADLSKIDEQMLRVPADTGIYTPDTVDILNAAVAAAQEPAAQNWDIRRQDEVDALAEALKNAIDGLKKVPAATPAKPELLEKTDSSIKINALAGQEYSIDNDNTWVSDGVFNNLAPASDYRIITRVLETSTSSMSAVSEPLNVTTDKSAVAAPAKPALQKVTVDSITVESVKGQEYSIDNGKSWQDNGVFSGLKPASEYEIITRVKETEVGYASKNSEALKVTTKEKTEPKKTVTKKEDEKKTDTKKENTAAVKTGDTANTGLWILLITLSAGIMVFFTGIKSRKNKES